MAVADPKSRVFRRSHDMEQVEARTAMPAVRYVWALARLSLGFVFVWAFVDKLFGLGHETTAKQAWIHGGHPTMGFLKFSAAGPFKGFYHSIAGTAGADWLFMLGLAGIGAALVLGVGMRFAAVAGTVMLVMMWSVVLPPENNVFMDDHLIYAPLLIGLALTGAGNALGLGRWWGGTHLVQRFPILK
jgi:thiosulfate dehydrogenase [quinone] large subunit